ncbi:flagellar basal body P-ring formation chaperone FlgA [Candidatus Enterovibrio altilux]|uniref:Flagella basal body P-ring formation protein FlgA n=1 Tax=Candidatus Enterovibrio altilux TaxID=1927128 RepID=A0A291B746_9GAMM|nr:flagellar basal body P-ring formation chaperone FlgA [Candidatus Enterovibrio luxaltus]ATF08815.1 Flagellar basal-body P-ring formation protein FlgA [Candidatus Enterovibrio luxaltus]
MYYQRLTCLFIGTFFIGFSSIIASAPTNQLLVVKKTAEKYVTTLILPPAQGELQVEARNIDSRLRLSNCPIPLETSVPGRQTLNKSVTVMVSCIPDDWQVYVTVQIKLLTPIVVANRPLDRGMTLKQDDLTIQLVDARFQRGLVYTRTATIIGSRIKRAVGMGQPVQGRDICMVCRNEKVVITARGNGLHIITKGTALSDGTLGDQIKVRNNNSNRIIDATIISVSQVTVKF